MRETGAARKVLVRETEGLLKEIYSSTLPMVRIQYFGKFFGKNIFILLVFVVVVVIYRDLSWQSSYPHGLSLISARVLKTFSN